MKLKLEELREAFAVLDAVAGNPALECSAYVRMRNAAGKLQLMLTGTLWAAAVVENGDNAKWQFFADRRLLKAFLATAHGDTVTAVYKDKQLQFKAGQTLNFPARADVGGYQGWPLTGANGLVLPTDQQAAIAMLVKFCPSVAGMEYTDAICFAENCGIVATDTIFMVAVLDEKLEPNLFLPTDMAALLPRYTASALASDAIGVGMKLGTAYLYQPLRRELKKYPKEQCLTMFKEALNLKAHFTVAAAALKEALDAVAPFLFDRTDTADIAGSAPITLTVNVAGGNWAREVSLKGGALKAPVTWPIKKLAYWVNYVYELDNTMLLGYAQTPAFCTFYTPRANGQQNVILFAPPAHVV